MTDSPLGAALGSLAVLIASEMLVVLDAADAIHPFLPTRYWLAWVDFFRDPIFWRDIERGFGLQAGLRGRAARRRVGQLHLQGRHELKPVCGCTPRFCPATYGHPADPVAGASAAAGIP